MFRYEVDFVYSVHVSDKKLEKFMDLLLIIEENKTHYVYTKDFNRFMWIKYKNKIYFCRHCFQCFSSEKVLQEH